MVVIFLFVEYSPTSIQRQWSNDVLTIFLTNRFAADLPKGVLSKNASNLITISTIALQVNWNAQCLSALPDYPELLFVEKLTISMAIYYGSI